MPCSLYTEGGGEAGAATMASSFVSFVAVFSVVTSALAAVIPGLISGFCTAPLPKSGSSPGEVALSPPEFGVIWRAEALTEVSLCEYFRRNSPARPTITRTRVGKTIMGHVDGFFLVSTDLEGIGRGA